MPDALTKIIMNNTSTIQHLDTDLLTRVTGGTQNGFLASQMFENARQIERKIKAQPGTIASPAVRNGAVDD